VLRRLVVERRVQRGPLGVLAQRLDLGRLHVAIAQAGAVGDASRLLVVLLEAREDRRPTGGPPRNVPPRVSSAASGAGTEVSVASARCSDGRMPAVGEGVGENVGEAGTLTGAALGGGRLTGDSNAGWIESGAGGGMLGAGGTSVLSPAEPSGRARVGAGAAAGLPPVSA
jgi:hypothetical protein